MLLECRQFSRGAARSICLNLISIAVSACVCLNTWLGVRHTHELRYTLHAHSHTRTYAHVWVNTYSQPTLSRTDFKQTRTPAQVHIHPQAYTCTPTSQKHTTSHFLSAFNDRDVSKECMLAYTHYFESFTYECRNACVRMRARVRVCECTWFAHVCVCKLLR
jgi:hypothetical protein